MASPHESPALSLTGVFNMAELALMPVKIPLGVLSRYAAGRVNIYTSEVGAALCRGFELAPQGRRNVQAALESLRSVTSVGNALEFGFGMQDVIRHMARTESGATCVALCAALKESYSDAVAVEVLVELAKFANVDGEHVPSGIEWKSLLSACAGALTASAFPLRAETFMTIVKDDRLLGAAPSIMGTRSVRSCSTPQSIAQALFVLGEISRGKVGAISFVGGPDAGWLAAVAEWFFDLKIAIANHDEPLNFKYINSLDTEGVQLAIYLQNTPQQTASSQSLQPFGKTYYLEDASELFSAELRSSSDSYVSGRVKWDSAFSSTFMMDFSRIMSNPQCVGQLFGSAARLFRAQAAGDPPFRYSDLVACSGYCDQSHGKGFVNSLLTWFPELKPLKTFMGATASQSSGDALRTYDQCIALLKQFCGCIMCSSCHDVEGGDANNASDEDRLDDESDDEMQSAHSEGEVGRETEVNFTDDDRYCLTILAETIIVLGRSLANVTCETKGLHPTRLGLEMAYAKQYNLHYSAGKHAQAGLSPGGQFIFVVDKDANSRLITDDGNALESTEFKLQTVLELFSGRDADIVMTTTAATVNGVCAYLGILAQPQANAQDLGAIHVLSGRIQYQKKTYDRVEDRARLERDDLQTFEQCPKVADCPLPLDAWTLSIRERSERLDCRLELAECHFDGSVVDLDTTFLPLRVGPGHLSAMLCKRRGLVACSRGKIGRKSLCKPVRPELVSPDVLKKAETENVSFQIDERSIEVFHCREARQAVATIAAAAQASPLSCEVYIGGDECVTCCVAALLKNTHPSRTHFAVIML